MLDYTKLTVDRLFRLRHKYHCLLFTSHDGGAGGVRDSEEWQMYSDILKEIDTELLQRVKEHQNAN